MKKFQYALAAAIMLLAVGCKKDDLKEPDQSTAPTDSIPTDTVPDEDALVKFKQEVAITSAEYINDNDGSLGNVIATGSNADYSVTLSIKGSTFVDGTYSAKCDAGESQVWGFLFGTDGEEDGGGTIYNIDSISATVKNYTDEGRIEITAKYYTAAHDSLFIVHFGQKITPVANKTINITDAKFLDYSNDGGYFVITNDDGSLSDGDFALYFSYYSTQFVGSYGVANFNTYFSAFGYVSGTGIEKPLTALYGTVEVKEAGTDSYSAVLKLMASDSIFYTINVAGDYAETGYAIDAEDDIAYTFDPANTSAQYNYESQNGKNYAAFILNDGTKYLQFIAFYENESDKDAVTIVPANAYYIGTYYESGTIAAGHYDADDGSVSNSYFATISGKQLTDPVYLLTDGAIVLSNEDGKCKIEVYATNSKGASVEITYTGTLTAAKNSTSNAPAKASKGIVASPNLFVRH